jgi:hypothetical protein
MANKKVVVVTMSPVEMYFKVPDGIDLEDESVVEDYGFKYGKLYIKYVGKEDLTIEDECVAPFYESDEED